MNWKSLFQPKYTYNIIYIATGILFLVWILFFDTHSWLTHRELDAEIDQLEGRKRQLNQAIVKDKIAIEQLQNEDSLEKFARETFGHKKKNETIFIVEEESLKNR